MFDTSPSIAALAAALAKAQASVEGATKGKVNPAFKSKYADLASVWEACREALTQNELSVVQSPGALNNGQMEMTTMLLHSSGEWIKGSLTIPLAKVDAQGYGSATTYARRFSLAAFVGVAPEDDDGNAASQPANAARQDAKSQLSASQLATHQLRSYANDQTKFLEFWTKNYQGWKGVMNDAEYASVVAEMKRISATFPKPQPKADEFGLNGDRIPEFN